MLCVMGRPPRIEYADAIYHVTTRGVEGRMIVLDDRDRSRWMEKLEGIVERYGWRVFAFALMGNHFHLFLQTPRPNLSKGMHDLNGGYVNFFNKRHEREGHLFQSRYRAYVVEDEGYWFEVSRYVHLNPVRAGLVTKPEDWAWSSYAGYHRRRQRLAWVDYDRVLCDFGRNMKEGSRRYRAFIEDGLGRELDSPFERAVHSVVLGSDAFVERIQDIFGSESKAKGPRESPSPAPRPALMVVIGVVADYYGVDPSMWAPGRRCNHPARRVAAYLARQLTAATSVEIAQALGYADQSSVASSCRRVESAAMRSGQGEDIRKLRERCSGLLTPHG